MAALVHRWPVGQEEGEHLPEFGPELLGHGAVEYEVYSGVGEGQDVHKVA